VESKKYMLDCGTEITINELRKMTGLSYQASRSRLINHTNLAELVEPVMQRNKTYMLDCGAEMTIMEMIKETGWSKTTCYRRLKDGGTKEHVLRSHQAPKKRHYELDDGTSVTVTEVMEITGLKRATISSRLFKHTNPDKIFAKQHGTPDPSLIPERDKSVYWGIPIEPSYDIGSESESFVVRNSICNEREVARKQWRKDSNTIGEQE